MAQVNKRGVVFRLVGVMLLLSISGFVWCYGFGSLYQGPRWLVSTARLRLGLEQDPSAGAYYERTQLAPLPLATVVKELRAAWPTESVALVHGAALEVGTALLHRGDIEMGEMRGGHFVPGELAPWLANERMMAEIKASTIWFDNEQTYVFRRKQG